jgi:hypothetical protein
MWTVIEAIAASVFKVLLGRWAQRRAAAQTERVRNEQAQAVSDAAQMRDQGDADAQASRERSAAAVDRVRADDAVGGGGVRDQLATVDAAIARADAGGDVR